MEVIAAAEADALEAVVACRATSAPRRRICRVAGIVTDQERNGRGMNKRKFIFDGLITGWS